MFPAPREVERYLYLDEPEKVKIPQFVFPAPLEVDREIYVRDGQEIQIGEQFPAPREVISPSLSLGCCSLMFINTANLAIYLQENEI